MKKLFEKLQENKGADTTIETSVNIFVYVIVFLLVTVFMDIMYKEYKLNVFSSELMRTAELYGQVGEQTNIRQKKLEKSLGIRPTVKWGKTGNYNLNEEINLSLSLKTDVKIPFFKNSLMINKDITGTSEVYRK